MSITEFNIKGHHQPTTYSPLKLTVTLILVPSHCGCKSNDTNDDFPKKQVPRQCTKAILWSYHKARMHELISNNGRLIEIDD